MGAQRLEQPMDHPRSRSGILVGLAAAVGAFGAAAMMSAATAPTARADDTTVIIDALDTDLAAGQADFTAASTDFGSGGLVPGLAELFDGVNADSLAASETLIYGTLEELTGLPVTGLTPTTDVFVPANFS